LNNNLTIDSLIRILESNPKSIDILEEIFQLKRFTNTQYIHFCFDVNILNNHDEDSIINHSKKCILNFENGKENKIFIDIYNKCNKNQSNNNHEIIYNIKRSIIEYVNKCIKKKSYSLYAS